MKYSILFTSVSLVLFSCSQPHNPAQTTAADTTTVAVDTVAGPMIYEQEKHLANIRQLTYGGNNAEAYWNFAGTELVFQSDNSKWGLSCDQIFTLNVSERSDSSKRKLVSTGKGRTTCSWWMPGDSTLLYATTHLSMDSCPPVADYGHRYVWSLYPEYEIVEANRDGKIIRQLTNSPRYDAEATVSPKGDKIIFTSVRSGDLELYTMNIDGTGLRQITNTIGYDGGACFSPDGTKIVWRASRPSTKEEVKAYKDLLKQDLVEPSNLEIWVANADGSSAFQVTALGKANWAPTFTPDGTQIIFCSNHTSQRGFPFNLYLINVDGTGLEQLTFDTEFDSFPMFSPDGKKFVWCSNRHNGRTRDTNIFIADWVK